MAQYAVRLGVTVTVLQRSGRLLSGEDPAVSAVLRTELQAEGVSVLTGVTLTAVEVAAGAKTVRYQLDSGAGKVRTQEILVALGRAPNTEGLNLAAAGVVTARGAVSVDRAMRTNAPHIFAAGDVTGVNMVVNLTVMQGEVAGHNAAHPAEVPRLVDDSGAVAGGLHRPAVRAGGFEPLPVRGGRPGFRGGTSRTSPYWRCLHLYPQAVTGFMSVRAARADGL